MRALHAATALLAVFMGACAPTPYQRPAVDVPESWRAPADTSAALTDRPFGSLLASEELHALIQVALENNRDLRIAAERVELARARYGFERSFLFPSVLGDAAYTRQRQPIGGRDRNVTSSVTSVGLAVPSWEIDLWGRVRAQTEAARRDLMAFDEFRRAVEVSLTAQVASAYLQLLELDAQLETAQRTVQTRSESLRVVQARFEGGVVSNADLMQARANLAEAQRAVASIEGGRQRAENALSVLLGRNPGPIARIRTLTDYDVDQQLPAGLPSQLLERRPDVRSAEQQLIGAQANIDAARRAFFPAISLTGFLGFVSPELSELFDGDRFAWSVTPAITAPIFTAGRLRSNVEAAQAQQRIVLEQYLQTIQNAFREVDDALTSYEELRRQREALERVVEANRERLRLAELRYRGGVTIYLEVLIAQQDLFDSELRLLQVRRGVQSAVVELYAALGGSWREAPVEPPPAASAPGMVVPNTAPDTALNADRIDVAMEGTASVVHIRHVRGVGGMSVRRPASGWPPAVRLQFHDFPTLDLFSARSTDATLRCETQGTLPDAPHLCTLDAGTVLDLVRRERGGYQVQLPAAMLAEDVDSVEVRWVDRYR